MRIKLMPSKQKHLALTADWAATRDHLPGITWSAVSQLRLSRRIFFFPSLTLPSSRLFLCYRGCQQESTWAKACLEICFRPLLARSDIWKYLLRLQGTKQKCLVPFWCSQKQYCPSQHFAVVDLLWYTRLATRKNPSLGLASKTLTHMLRRT